MASIRITHIEVPNTVRPIATAIRIVTTGGYASIRSMIAALAMPPPSHIVWSP